MIPACSLLRPCPLHGQKGCDFYVDVRCKEKELVCLYSMDTSRRYCGARGNKVTNRIRHSVDIPNPTPMDRSQLFGLTLSGVGTQVPSSVALAYPRSPETSRWYRSLGSAQYGCQNTFRIRMRYSVQSRHETDKRGAGKGLHSQP